MSFSRKALPIFRLISREYAKEPPKIKVHPKFKKLKENQKRFGVDDNFPVFLKKGLADRLLYQASWAYVLVGVGLSVELFVRMVMRDLAKE
jgi:hypothetical protein